MQCKVKHTEGEKNNWPLHGVLIWSDKGKHKMNSWSLSNNKSAIMFIAPFGRVEYNATLYCFVVWHLLLWNSETFWDLQSCQMPN